MVNSEIKSKEVRLVTDEGANVLNTKDALKQAEEMGMDLICINSNGDIPVVRIGDYSKFLYDQKKKKKLQDKKNKLNQVETKEIRISDVIAINDLKTKAKLIDKFLTSKNKVKLTIRYRGRAIAHINEGESKLMQLVNLLSVQYKIETPAKIAGNTVSMVIEP